jgi:hypothetical protein
MRKSILAVVGQSILTAALVSVVVIWVNGRSNRSVVSLEKSSNVPGSTSNSGSGQQFFVANFQPYRVDLGTRLVLLVKNRSGRFTANLGGNRFCDINGSQTQIAYVRDLVPGVVALQISARDFGRSKYDVDFELRAMTPTNHDSTLVGPFTYTNPEDKASESVEGTTIYIEVPQQNAEVAQKNGGKK